MQVSRHKRVYERVALNETPTLELSLDDNQRIVSLEVSDNRYHVSPERKTCDWTFVAWVETRL